MSKKRDSDDRVDHVEATQSRPRTRACGLTYRSSTKLPEPYFILRGELLRLIPYSIQHIGRLEERFQFPRRVEIGRNRVAWVRTEVMAWLSARLVSRPQAPQSPPAAAAQAPPSVQEDDPS